MTNVVSDLQWAWLAGLIDGDGCIKVSVNRSPAVHMEIGTNDLALAAYIQTTYSGRIDHVYQPNGRPFYRWHATAQWMRQNLEYVLPFLVYKKRQGKAAHELLRLRALSRGGAGKHQPERQSQLIAEITVANNHIWDRTQRGI